MERKKFISSALLTIGSLKAMSASLSASEADDKTSKIPPYLKKGDTIAICSPAGYISVIDCTDAVNMMESWGFKIKVGSSIGKKDFTFGGTDEERLADFQQMLDDTSVKAIMCARGGYGIIRIIDKLNFSTFVKKPKWIIGFSDATVLHSHINKNFGIATIHSKMCNSFVNPLIAEPIQLETLDSIRKCLSGDKMIYNIPANTNNKKGKAKGILIGGNLKTIESLAGSASDINTKNKILFVEDTGEYLYSIDRMFFNLKRSGKLSQLAGLIVGGLKIKKEEEGSEFGKTGEQIVLEKVSAYNYPVCFDFPVGHQKNNFALKCGVMHELTVNIDDNYLREL
ncbi:MAG: LD-carboxypeptidase [Ferruginibacter sp.]|nr:LD-carboxypeptidase [Ferruginibacter sp.]